MSTKIATGEFKAKVEEQRSARGRMKGKLEIVANDTTPVSRKIAAGDFKAKCLALLDEVADQRSEIIVTKRGRAVARLVPLVEEPRSAWGWMKGKMEIVGDIVSPAYDGPEVGAHDPDHWYRRTDEDESPA